MKNSFSSISKFAYCILAYCLLGIGLNSLHAQVTGVKQITVDYPDLASAIADLNAVGVGAGGATINVPAGYTETLTGELVLTMPTASSSETNPLVIQKLGAGANPLITAFTGTGTTDGMVKLNGADHVTIDGIDLQENGANTDATMQMEWGYALLKVSASNGCHYNTIKNCVITLNKANTASRCMYAANHTINSTTSLTTTAFSGTNSHNKFYNNTLQNSYDGCNIMGYSSAGAPYDLYDQGNEFGVDGVSTNRNMILDFGGASISTNGILASGQNNIKIFHTYISGGTGCTNVVNGISTTSSTNANVDIYNDTLTLVSSGTTSTMTGISNGAGVSGAGNTINIYNCVVTNCAYPTATSAIFRGIAQTTTASYTNIHHNTISNNTFPGTGDWSGIYYSGSSATLVLNVNINDNVVSGNTKIGAGGIFNMIYASGSTFSTNTFNNQCFNNNSSTSSGAMYGYYNFAVGVNENVYNNTLYNNTGGTGEVCMLYVLSGTGTTNKEVYGNTLYNISGAPAAATVSGIYLSYGTICNVYKNNIYNITNNTTSGPTPATAGINIGTNNNIEVTTYNNFISELKAPNASNTTAIYGIWLQGSSASNLSAYHNTIYLNAFSTGANFGTSGITCTGVAVKKDVRNNIIVNVSTPAGTGTTKALTFNLPTAYSTTSGYNCLYAGTPGASRLIFSDGFSNLQNIQEFKNSITPADQASFSEMPPFINIGASPYDLHLQTGIATQCESGGKAVASVSLDYDGNSRGATPDVGADEFTGIMNDIASPDIQYTVITSGPFGPVRDLSNFATITDPSGINTTVGTRPRLYFKKTTQANTFNTNDNTTDGWKYVEATNTTSPFSFMINYSMLLGAFVLPGDIIQYFVIAQDLNGTPRIGMNKGLFAVQPTSVALTAANFPLSNTINQYSIVSSFLSGTINVPGTFPSLTNNGGLFQAINVNGGLSGNLTVQITADLLSESGDNPLSQWAEDGVGNYTLTIVPNAAVQRTISGNSATNALISLNSADRVTIDGRFGGSGTYLTFRNTSNSRPTIGLLNDAMNNTITYSIIESGNTSTAIDNTGGAINIGNTLSQFLNGNDNNTISYCEIRDRSDAAATPNYLIVSTGYSTGIISQYNHNLIISNNRLHDWYLANGTSQFAIYSGTGTSNYTISDNSFYQTSTRTQTAGGAVTRAIHINNASAINANGGNTITGNYIGGTAPLCGGTDLTITSAFNQTFTGIFMATGMIPNSIQGNTIRKINFTLVPSALATVWAGMSLNQGIYNVGTTTGNVIGDTTGNDHITITVNAGAAANSFLAGILYAGINGYANIQNNRIGGITMAGTTSSGGILPQWIQIQGTPSQTNTVSNNFIGSGGTANSIRNNATSASCVSFGLRQLITSGAALIANNNTVSNITDNSSSPSSANYGFLLISTVGGINNLTLTNNTIKNMSINGTAAIPSITNYGISIQNMGGLTHNVSGNNIYNINNANPGAFAGYAMGIQTQGNSCGGTMSKNRIWNIRNSNSSGSAGIAGIYITAGADWTLSNNMISISNTGNTNILFLAGIVDYTQQNAKLNLYYNSVYIGGSSILGPQNSFAYQKGSNSTVSIKNNVFYNERTGGAVNYAFGNTSSTPSVGWNNESSDYNALVTADTTKIADWNSTALNLSAFRATSGGDANTILDLNTSTTSSVLFTETSTANLHLNTSTFCINSGTNLAAVSDDYDGQTRSIANTSIGADEVACAGLPTVGTIAATSAGPFCVSVANDTLTLNGFSDVSGISLQWSSSDNVAGPYNPVGAATTNPILYTGTLTDTTYFICTITCLNLGSSATSSPLAIIVNPAPISNAGADQITCGASPIAMAATATNGTGMWSGGAGSFSLASSATATYTPHASEYGTTVTLSWTVTGNAPCGSAMDFADVVVQAIPAAPTLMASNYTPCGNTQITLTATAAGGFTGVEYLWFKNGTAVNSGLSNTYNVNVGNTSGAINYSVEMVYTGYNCLSQNSANATVTVFAPSAIITPSGPTSFCVNTPTTLNATAGMSNYLWKRSTTTVQSGASAAYVPTASGNHNVTVTDANGCTKTSAWMAVTVKAIPTANAGLDKNVCDGSSVQIGAAGVGGNTYTWTPATALSNANISNPMASPTTNTSYNLTVNNTSTGCSNTDAVNVNVLSLPSTPSISSTPVGNTVTLTANSPGAVTINWYRDGLGLYVDRLPNSSISVYHSNPTKAYTVKSKGANGCLSNPSTAVNVKIGNEKGGDIIIGETVLQAYPNPVSDVLNVDIMTSEIAKGRLLLYNNLGQILWEEEINAMTGIASTQIDMSHLAAGVYTLAFQTENGNYRQKVVKE